MSLRRDGLVFLSLGLCGVMSGAESKPARITAVVHDVKLVSSARPGGKKAEINDGFSADTAVKTGADSRAEITLPSDAIVRVGATTTFRCPDGDRNFDVEEGVALLQVPKNVRGAAIKTAGIGAAVSGTTVMFENHPNVFKFLVLEGTARLYRPGRFGDSVLVRAGQMVFGDPKAKLGEAVDFDVARFVKTCRLITEFAPLGSATRMASESRKQEKAKQKKTLIDTNLVIFGNGTAVSLVDPNQAEKAGATAEESSSPIPASAAKPAQNAINAVESARSISR